MSDNTLDALVVEFAELKQLRLVQKQVDVLVEARMRTIESLLLALKGTNS